MFQINQVKYNITLYSYNEGDQSDPTYILAQTALPAPMTFKADVYKARH